MYLKSSKVKNVCKLLNLNPNIIFDNKTICQLYNSKYTKDKLEVDRSTTILSRLFRKGMLLRTKTQLKDGYFYSLNNIQELNEVYNNYLLPYDFDNKEELMNLIIKNKFEDLGVTEQINKYLPINSNFVNKYGLDYILNERVRTFIAINIGFLMCDGHIKKDFGQVQYFFNQEEDAELFKSDFLSIFNQEKLSLNYVAYCYKVGICSKNLTNFFNLLGVPAGNKVYQPFLVPNWIYNGSNSIKRAFLSVLYGNEGSKPQHNVWRVQFVLSKTKEYVPNLLKFLNQIRTILNHFGISTSHIQLRKQAGRAFSGRFYIKGRENLTKFHNEIGFLYASEKQNALKLILQRKNLKRIVIYD